MSEWPPAPTRTDEENVRQAEIARIRALRGRPVPLRKTIEEVAQEKITPLHMVLAFTGAQGPEDAIANTKVFDLLPAALRAFIRESPVYISPVQVASMLADVPNVELVIHMIEKQIPGRARELVAKNYGDAHPQRHAEKFDLRTERTAKSLRANRYQEWLVKRQMRRW